VTGEPIRVLVVDDEPLARATLVGLLAADPEVRLVGQAGSGREALPLLREADLVFLDVHMPGGDAFKLLGRAGDRRPAIIFVTAYDAHALRAFEVAALDYVLKPFDDERFGRALERGKAQVRGGRAAALTHHLASLFENGAAAAPRPPDRIAVKDRGRMVFVPVDAIDWIGAEDYYAELHVGRATHLLREPLTELEARLDPTRFVRVHRSAIVNLTRVREVESSTRGDAALVLDDGTRLRLSRGRRAAILARLGVAAR
jgi:two-component system, LytTR family, response regulator